MTSFQLAALLRAASLAGSAAYLHLQGAKAAAALPGAWALAVAASAAFARAAPPRTRAAWVAADIAAASAASAVAGEPLPIYLFSVPVAMAGLLVGPLAAVGLGLLPGLLTRAVPLALGRMPGSDAALLTAFAVAVPPLAGASVGLLSRSLLRERARTLRSVAVAQRSLQLPELLSYVLFQIREYLTSITSVTEHIALSGEDPVVRDLAEKMQRIIGEANAKVGRLLDSMKANTTSRRPVGGEEFLLRDVLADCLAAAEASYPARPALRFWCDPGIGPLRGDPETLRCVFLSVLANALEALEGRRLGGRLSVSARRLEPYAEVEIVDDGGGIAAADLPDVFTPLHTTKSNSGGLGLGLSMSRRMMERMGGTLGLRSEGGRTLVRVQVPLGPRLPFVRPEEATWPGRRAG